MGENDTILYARDGQALPITRSGTGRPIVFLHGWAIGPEAFDAAHERLSGEAMVVSYVQRGHGPAGPVAAPTMEHLAGDLADLLNSIDAKDAILVGWSMGAMVAWLAMAEPAVAKRVAGVVSIDMTPRVTNDASWALGFSDGRRAADMLRSLEVIESDWSVITDLLRERIFAPGKTLPSEKMDRVFSGLDNRNTAAMASIWESMAVQDCRRLVPRLHHPLLLVHGGESQLYRPETGVYLKRITQNSSLCLIPNTGHAPHLEEPDRFYSEISRFCHSCAQRLDVRETLNQKQHAQGGNHA